MKQQLIIRFRYLWMWELVNAVIVFPAFVSVLSQTIETGILTTLALVAVCLLLLIGATFSYLKYRDLKNETKHLQKWESIFYTLRWVIPLLLVILFFASFLQIRPPRIGDAVLALILYLLAILEYINYFHVQLMYDSQHDISYLVENRQLKRGLFAREYSW